MNTDNLVPIQSRTTSEQRAIQKAGGIASGKARLKKKHGRELVRAILEMKETDPRIIDEMVRLGLNKTDLTNEVVMHVRQIEKAKRKADTKAYNSVNKAAGYIEDDGVNINIATEEPPVIIFGDTSQVAPE